MHFQKKIFITYCEYTIDKSIKVLINHIHDKVMGFSWDLLLV